MDVKEKLVELQGIITCPNAICNFCEHFKNKSACEQHKKEVIADNMIAHGVTVREWISVDDELPKYTDEYNVIVGVPSEFGYFEKVTTLRFERIKGKEPRWVIPKNENYNVISWMLLPQPPKGE